MLRQNSLKTLRLRRMRKAPQLVLLIEFFRRFRFAAGEVICEAGHVQSHARKPSCKDEDADNANGQILNHDAYKRKAPQLVLLIEFFSF